MKIAVLVAALCLVQVALGHDCKDCEGTPMDISFVVDASSSVMTTGFQHGLDFICQLLEHFTISQTAVRASVITFSGQSTNTRRNDYQDGAIDEASAIGFEQSVSKEALKAAIMGIPYIHKLYTNTSAGIEYALDHQMTSAREGVKKVMVVITDGRSQEDALTASEGQRARDSGLSVFAVGVGPDVDTVQLHKIAGEMSRVILATSYKGLLEDAILEELTHGICIPDKKDEKECRMYPVDLMFVIDTSSTISHAEHKEGLRFIASILDVMEIDDGRTRVAAVQYSTGVKGAIPFGQYNTRADMKKAILSLKNHGGDTHTGAGIDKMRELMQASPRPEAAKVMIVITDGESNYRGDTQAKSTETTIKAADRAREAGATIISIGIGLDAKAHESELVKIADNRSQMLTVKDFNRLKEMKEDLKKEYCNAAKHMLAPR